MALNLRPPSQSIGSTEDKLRNLYSYLFQMTEELNQAISNVENSSRDTLYRAVSGGGSGGKNKVPQTTAEAYQQIKSLIIKTAKSVTSSMQKLVTEMSAEYRAQSEYGTYEEFLNNKMTTSAEGILFDWNSENQITTNVAEFSEYKANSDVYMKIGIVGYNEDGTVEAGVVVGRDLQKVTINGKEILKSENVYSLLRADGLSLWQNGAKLTEVSLMGFMGEKAYINEISTKLLQSPEMGAQLALNETMIEGIAEKIVLKASDSIKLVVKDDLEELGTAIELTDDKISLLVEDGSTASNIQLTQGAIQAISDEIVLTTAKKLESDSGTVIINDDGVAMTGGEISMVTRENGYATGAVVINEDGIAAAGAKISLVTEGDNFLNINSEGISASSIAAPNVAPMYSGPTTINVDPNATSDQIEAGTHVRSIAEAFSLLNYRFVSRMVTIKLAPGMTDYGTATLIGVTGGRVNVEGYSSYHAKHIGAIQLYYNTAPISIKYLDIDAGKIAVEVLASLQVILQYCIMNGSNIADGAGVWADQNASVTIGYCEAYNFGFSFLGANGGMISSYNCQANCRLRVNRSIMFASVFTLKEYTSWEQSVSTGAIYTSGVVVDSAATETPEADPIPSETKIGATNTGTYCGGWRSGSDILQGYHKDSGNNMGCMWFTLGISSARTVMSATLTLTRIAGTGRGGAVPLRLFTISKTGPSGGSPSAMSYTNYGDIGSIEEGQTKEFAIPVAAAQEIVNGTRAGFALFTDVTTTMTGTKYSYTYCRINGTRNAPDVLGLKVNYT